MLTYGHQGMKLCLAGRAELKFAVVVDEDDKWIRNADEAIAALESAGTLGAHPIDIWPIRECLCIVWLNGADGLTVGRLPFWIWGKKFQANMEHMKKATHLAITAPYNEVKRKFVSAPTLSFSVTPPDNMTRSLKALQCPRWPRLCLRRMPRRTKRSLMRIL